MRHASAPWKTQQCISPYNTRAKHRRFSRAACCKIINLLPSNILFWKNDINISYYSFYFCNKCGKECFWKDDRDISYYSLCFCNKGWEKIFLINWQLFKFIADLSFNGIRVMTWSYFVIVGTIIIVLCSVDFGIYCMISLV